MKENYFLIPGSFGSPFVNWFPWLREKIENEGKEIYTPDFPTGVGFQNYENWKKLLRVYLEAGLIHENTTFVCHSIAPVFVCKFLIEHQVKVKKLLFVCGFNNYFGINEEYNTVNGTMYTDALPKIKEYCSEIICFYTDNDPYVKMDAESEFARIVATKEIVVSGGGHLNRESGYDACEFLLPYLR